MPSLPGAALWGDSDPPSGTGASGFAGLVTPPATPLPTIGHIGRYALKYQLGEGGLGTVYAAHDPLLSRLIAVKTLNVEVPESERESFNALFINEARAAGGLSHPHIVTVFDAGISDKRAYIAMEMLKGRDSKTRSGTRENWLLIKHRDGAATEAGDSITEKFTTSIETGRTLDGKPSAVHRRLHGFDHDTRAAIIRHGPPGAGALQDHPVPRFTNNAIECSASR